MLPDLIEIVPLERPVCAQITVPGSKSITNRALLLAALAEGETTLQGALWSEDTQIMVECLQELGFMVNVEADAAEVCNRTISVYGKGGIVPPGGTADQPLELFVGNAGTAARFLSAFVCLGTGVYRLSGVDRMHQRPEAGLFRALRELGYRVESERGDDKLPARIFGGGPAPGEGRLAPGPAGKGQCTVSILESSQFASALLLCARAGGWQVRVTGENAEESSYVAMTAQMVEVFPWRGGRFRIEPDASSGSYFWAAGWLQTEYELFGNGGGRKVVGAEPGAAGPGWIEVRDWPASGWQRDADFTDYIRPGSPCIPTEISRAHDLADSIMTAIVLAPLAFPDAPPIRFTDLGRLRVQECERVAALRTELTRCGARVVEAGDTLTVYPSKLHGAEIETYEDHRMAMCFAIPGLKVPGVRIKNPGCVKKTFPNFFQKLAAPPPGGLGVTILDAKNKSALTLAQLFAE